MAFSWRSKIEKELGLELRLYALPTLLKTGTREGVWRETCARLGTPAFRQGYRRAVGAVEESVGIRRDLDVQGDLAMSLGASAQHYRRLAEEEAEDEMRRQRLVQSEASIREALGLFREVGERWHYLLALQEAFIALLLLQAAQEGAEMDSAELANLCTEGLRVAEALEDAEALAFFRQFESDPSTPPPAPPARTATP